MTNAATPAFLDEYDAAGTLVQSIALPTADDGSNRQLTNNGTASSEGFLARSTDGRYLTFGGYDADPGTTNPASLSSSAVNRVVGRVDGSGVVDTSIALSDAYSIGNIRSVVTDDGTRYWTGGSNAGVRFATAGATTSTSISTTTTNIRVVDIDSGQLYATSGSASNLAVNRIGSGLPTTSGQVATPIFPLLTGSPTPSPYGFTFLDRNAAVPGNDTLYLADDTSTGLRKYSFDGTTWTARGTFALSTRGLTGTVTGSTATLYATTTTGAGSLVRIVDTAASDAAISATSTVVATGLANTAFRGVAFAPTGGSTTPTAPSITDQPDSTTINPGQTATLTVVATGTAPLSYQWYLGASGDTSDPIDGATASSYTTPALVATTSYWVRVSNDTGVADSATATVTISSAVPCVDPVTAIGAVQGSGETSPLLGQTVTVRGTVVGDHEGAQPALQGFYLQDAGDENAATSDGLFVFNPGQNNVAIGDVVEVRGIAAENQGKTQIAARTSPPAVPLTVTPCGDTGAVTPTEVTLPFASATTPETYEGMLVRFPQQLSVTELFQLGRFGQVTVSAGGRLYQPTNVIDAGTSPQSRRCRT
ncbi:MAG: hypothetical protein M3513_18095 [Actinomycetota bacterium]|nr:hypothetical protein [Actinomycetota bacterium]